MKTDIGFPGEHSSWIFGLEEEDTVSTHSSLSCMGREGREGRGGGVGEQNGYTWLSGVSGPDSLIFHLGLYITLTSRERTK